MTPLKNLTPYGLFLLGEEPTIEDFILLIGTIVAFIAFVLWCCFPIQPKETFSHQQFACKSPQNSASTLQNYYNSNCSGNRNGAGSMHGSKLERTRACSDLNRTTYGCCSRSEK